MIRLKISISQDLVEHVHRGHPLQDLLILLVIDLLRRHHRQHPTPRLAHQDTRADARGPGRNQNLTGVLEATVRDP